MVRSFRVFSVAAFSLMTILLPVVPSKDRLFVTGDQITLTLRSACYYLYTLDG